MWSVITRQTNIIWVAFTMGVSMIRELKDVDIAELEADEKSKLPRAWMIFDPPAVDAKFPRMCPTSLRALTTQTTMSLQFVNAYALVFLTLMSYCQF
jgi:hypothetical protein